MEMIYTDCKRRTWKSFAQDFKVHKPRRSFLVLFVSPFATPSVVVTIAKVVTRIIPAWIIVIFIVYFGLLSGDEMGMLEDACVSIANLTCVKFKVNMTFWF